MNLYLLFITSLLFSTKISARPKQKNSPNIIINEKIYSLNSNFDSSIDLKVTHFKNINKRLNRKPKTIVLTVHGYGDTSNYYQPLAEHLATHNIETVTFDQRQHGINKKDGPPNFTNFDAFESDILQILTDLRKKFPRSKLFLYGHSMGGGIVANLGLTEKGELKTIKISGFVFEDPFLKLHPMSAKWYQKVAAKTINSVSNVLGLTSPILPGTEVNLEYVSENEEIREKMRNDVGRTAENRANVAVAFMELEEFFKNNLRKWDRDFIVSLHVAKLDRLCDRQASLDWFDRVLEKKNGKNEIKYYETEGHDLKASLDPVPTKFFENVAAFVKSVN